MNAEESPESIDLAREPDFRLGALLVRPSRREIGEGEARELLEPRVMQALVALARRADEVVSRDQLIDSCWDGRIVGDDAVNGCVAKVRRVGAAHRAFAIETIPRVGYRLQAQTRPDAPSEPRSEPEPLLAVLPFDNLSDDPQLGFFSDGISEEILHALVQRVGLKVIGRASSFQFRGADKALRRVADELRATHVLDGSVRRAGKRLRITAQLVETDTQTTLWTERFERRSSDSFLIEDEIAAAVAESLRRTLAPGARRAVDPVVHETYLRAQSMIRDLVAGHATLQLLDEVIRRDPGFAPAWVSAAAARLQIVAGIGGDWTEVGAEEAGRLMRDARAAAARARELAPDDPETVTVTLNLHPICPLWRQLEAQLAAARARWPNHAGLMYQHGCFLLQVGRIVESGPVLKEAYRLDPLHAAAGNACAVALRAGGDAAQACAVWSDLVLRYPTAPLPFFNLLFSLASMGDWEQLDRWLSPERLAHLPARSQRARGILFAIDAMRAGSQRAAHTLAAGIARDVARDARVSLAGAAFAASYCDLDWLYGVLGELSFEWLRDPLGLTAPGDGGIEMLFMPDFWRLRSDRRFVGLCDKLGYVEYWAETGRWPDCVAETATDYNFKAECRRTIEARRQVV